MKNLFNNSLFQIDSIIKHFIDIELSRQQSSIELIASENIVSKAVLEAQGSILTNKYAEGYPSKRYYAGCRYVDEIEKLAVKRVKKLYGVNFANVQAHSGSQANQAVFTALLKPYDKIVSLSLDCGGHLTHGSKVNVSGQWFEIHHYFVDKTNYQLDYDQIITTVKKTKPKLIITGGSAYSRKINFAKFREIADEVGAYLLADIAHISGIIAAGYHQNPVDYAHVVTSTTHKTLRGPRGGMILTNHEDIAKKINLAIFPGIQGGPLMHVIAAKAVAFNEALNPSFKNYIKQVLLNAKVLAEELLHRGYNVVTGGTDTHLILLDLRKQKITGKIAEALLEKIGLTCNKNCIPFDDAKPFITSGIRLGTASTTTRGFKQKEFKVIANLIADALDELAINKSVSLKNQQIYLQKVKSLCIKFPIYT